MELDNIKKEEEKASSFFGNALFLYKHIEQEDGE
jgi:hypothetical protein